MIKRSVVCSLLVGFVALALSWPAAAKAEEAVTVQGEIVDMACYLPKGSHGPAHKSCAQMCAKRGAPIGVLTDAGELYLLVDDHNNPDPFEAAKKLAGDRAEVHGTKVSKPGVSGLVVEAVKGL
ncbi:MAG: hypothetical protein ACHQ9S_11260 [Candidatus Binatia bacterium]